MHRLVLLLLPVLFACGPKPYAEVGGSLGGVNFDEAVSVFHGGPYILIFDREIDCLDTWWVAKSYTDDKDPTEDSDLPFNAIQLQANDDDKFQVGTFSVAGDAPVSAYGLLNADAFVLERGREGQLTITEIDEKNEWIEGEFDVAFTEGEVTGVFRTAFCRNMEP